jgi:hypothetical protein
VAVWISSVDTATTTIYDDLEAELMAIKDEFDDDVFNTDVPVAVGDPPASTIKWL